MKPPTLGTINGFVASRARFGDMRFVFDGTTKGLTLAAVKAGAKAGDYVEADFGGGFHRYYMIATPWDKRAGGMWCDRSFSH